MRLPQWDYAQAGAYFITICTYARECILEDPEMKVIAEDVWRNVVGEGDGEGEFVVMPNHVHGIVWISPEAAVVGAR